MSLSDTSILPDAAVVAAGVLVAAGFLVFFQQSRDPHRNLCAYRAACACGVVWFTAWRVAAADWDSLPLLASLAAATFVASRRARLCQSCRAIVPWFSPHRPCRRCGQPVVR
jgi:hypothetical protein